MVSVARKGAGEVVGQAAATFYEMKDPVVDQELEALAAAAWAAGV